MKKVILHHLVMPVGYISKVQLTIYLIYLLYIYMHIHTLITYQMKLLIKVYA